MAQPEFHEIKPLLVSALVKGEEMHCTFRCPRTDFEASSSASLNRGSSYSDRLIDKTMRNFKYRMRSAVWSKAREMLGNSALGKIASDFVYDAVDGATPDQIVTKSENEEAILKAFQQVRSSFQFTDEGWVASVIAEDYTHDFIRHLKSHPIKLRYDRFILARVMAHIAQADGDFSVTEKEIFNSFAPPEFNAWGQPPSVAELKELSQGVKQTILMLSWALAFCDAELAHQELTSILKSAGSLGLPSEDLQNSKQWAQEYLVDRGLESAYRKALVDSQELERVRELATTLGLDTETLERLEIRCQKRHGSFPRG